MSIRKLLYQPDTATTLSDDTAIIAFNQTPPSYNPGAFDLDGTDVAGSATLADLRTALGSPYYPIKVGEVGVTAISYRYGDPRRHGAVGDETTNDTTALQNCVTSCLATGYPLFVDAFCTYAIINVTANGTSGALKNLVIVGAGRGLSKIIRHSSALTTQSDLITTTYVNVETRDVAFDHQWSGAAGSTKACIFAYKATRVSSTRCSYANGQYHGLNIAACNNISVEDNDFDHCYYSGCSVGGGLVSGSDLPYGANTVNIRNNRFTYCYGGAIVQVYVYDLTITGNQGRNSSIQVGQPCFRVNVSTNTIYGSNTTFGAGTIEPASDGIFLEAPMDCTVAGNILNGVAGNGINATGSEIHTVPSGPNEGILPLIRTAIYGNQVYNPGGTGILVSARSTDVQFPGTPNVDGSDGGIHHNKVIGGAVGMAVNNCDGGIVSMNYVKGAQTHGITVAGSRFVHFIGNTSKNNSQVSVGTYHGFVLSQAAFGNVVQDNFIYDDQTSTTQAFGIYDQVLDGGVASMTRYKGNTFYGNRAANIYPAPALPTLGTWSVNDFIEDIAAAEYGSAGSKFTRDGWKCIAAGTPGTWIECRRLTGN